jgi:hypothetical protein
VHKIEITPAYTRPPWLINRNETIDLTMCAISKGASKERIKAEFTSVMADKYEEYDQIYTDGSLKDDKVGFAIVTNNQIIKKRMTFQSSVHSAEQQRQWKVQNEQTNRRSYPRTFLVHCWQLLETDGPGTRKRGILGTR